MRFLMLNWRDPRNPQAGGAERVSMEYLAELARRGHEVWWFTHAFPGGAREETINGVRILREGGTITSILAARRWCRRQPRFDLVLDQHHGIPWYAPWWSRTTCVAYIHEVLGPIWSAFYPWPVSTVGCWQERWTHWFYRRVPFFTASAFTKRKLMEHGVRDVTIIPYGVHTVAIPELEHKPLTMPLRLIVVSRLAPNKRIDHAVRTLRVLLDQKVDARLTIIGGGEEEEKLKRLARELQLCDCITFTGPLPEKDKDERLRGAHFLLHNSQREGWGLNVIEANAMGTPAAVYPVAGLVESTLHDETGLVAEAETPEALAAVLKASLAAPERYQHYRRQAWERAKSFHWNQVLPCAANWMEEQARRATSDRNSN